MPNQQTETDLWQELREAIAMPQSASLKRLCELLDWVIAQLPEEQKLEAAGRAIKQMVELYALRFHVLMGIWEEAEFLTEESLPVLDLEALEAWLRQSMSVDLDALVDQPKSRRHHRKRASSSSDSVLAIVEPEAILQMVEQIEEEHRQMIRQLAGQEDPAKWSATITRWMQVNRSGQWTRLTQLRCELQMPLVEIWLGVLLGRFELEQSGEFYEGEILIRLV